MQALTATGVRTIRITTKASCYRSCFSTKSSRASLLGARREKGRNFRRGKGNSKAAEAKAIQSIFKRADTSGDGIISQSEYEAFFSALSTQANAAGVNQNTFVSIMSKPRRGNSAASSMLASSEGAASSSITFKQYALLSFKSGLPFVAFGFVDNAIMIMAGDMIEANIGATLALSTMAAAGIGNMFSDVIGIAATDSIEQLCDKLGLPSAGLTASQICSASARAVHVLSQACGIALGCILGLFPLLFLDQEAKQLRQCFDEADVDGDGQLSADEITMGFHRFGLMVHPEAVYDLMAICDTDHNGKVSFEEFRHLIKTHSTRELEKEISSIESKQQKGTVVTK